ncbi:hypothetical protein E4U41_002616 [Claviceps citrina]|nr:hypothetical protein E4U41_002616 [Claviceps citrina]
MRYLSAAVDVYGEWVDAADAVAKADATNIGYNDSTKTPKLTKRSQNSSRNAGLDEEAYGGEGRLADDDNY